MKNIRAFRLLLLANIISGFAQGISMLSIPWYFTSQLKQGSTFAFWYAIITFFTMFWSMYAGTIIDRYPRKNIFIGINIMGGLILTAVAITGFVNHEVPPWMVILVFATTLLVYNIHYPALYAFGQEIAEQSHYGRMNSYFEIQGQATTMIAGSIGAVLLAGTTHKQVDFLGYQLQLPFEIKAWKLHHIFLMDALTYFISIMLIAAIRYVPTQHLIIHTGTVWERTKMGWEYLRKNPLLFRFGNASYAVFVVLLLEVHVLLPWYVHNHLGLGADSYASAEIYYTFGALFAGLAMRRLAQNVHPVKAILLLMFLSVLGFALCGITQSTVLFFGFSVLIGITNAGIRVFRELASFPPVRSGS